MKKIHVADGLDITGVVIGIERLGLYSSAKECFAFIDRYLESGGNCIDTARLYNSGETDKVLGEWLKLSGRRDDIVLCTKGSHNDISTGVVRISPENIISDLETSLMDIGVDHTDLHLLHRDNIKMPVSEIMPAVDKLVRSGKARAVGVSNWTASRIVQANRFATENGLTPFSISQLQYSLAVTTPPATGDLTHIIMNDVEYGWYHETQFPIMAYSAQARGYFIKLAQGLPITRKAVLDFYDNFPENHRRLERIKTLSEKLGRSVAELCVAYVLCAGLNAAALITVSDLSQLGDVLASVDIELTAEQIRYLNCGGDL